MELEKILEEYEMGLKGACMEFVNLASSINLNTFKLFTFSLQKYLTVNSKIP